MKQIFVNEYGRPVMYVLLGIDEVSSKDERVLHDLLTAFGLHTIIDPIDNPTIQIGPQPSIETPTSTDIVGMAHSAGLTDVVRVEKVYLYEKPFDVMTSMVYDAGFDFTTAFTPDVNNEPALPICSLDVFVEQGQEILQGHDMGEEDIRIWYPYFLKQGRVPTETEVFQIVNGNTEHSRHGFFGARQVIDGHVMQHTLFEMIKQPWKDNPNGVVIAFHDNASAMYGYTVREFIPSDVLYVSPYHTVETTMHHTITAETHNFPTTVEPYQGATTGLGGMLRDLNCAGTGSQWVNSFAGYIVGEIRFTSGYRIPGEYRMDEYPTNIASGLDQYIRGIMGVADYGNCAGIPTTLGFSRSFSQMFDERLRANQKCVLYAGGGGTIRHSDIKKQRPQTGDKVIQIGGPAYRVGFGGGKASSGIQDTANEDRDRNAVQRGNPAMGNALKRVAEALVLLGVKVAHDQGAAGPMNAVTESVEQTGAVVDIRAISSGDTSMSVIALWGSEPQERNAYVVSAEIISHIQALCRREGVYFDNMGTVDDSNMITVIDSQNPDHVPVQLPLDLLLQDLGQQTFTDVRIPVKNPAFVPDTSQSLDEVIRSVWAQIAVGHKGHVVYRKDRTVGGRTVQAQTLGPIDFPISDYSLTATDLFGTMGQVITLGEQSPMVTANAQRGARMTLAEAYLNSVGVIYDNPGLIVNWMWPAKRKGQNAKIYDACQAVSEAANALGIPTLGGKDSLSMINKFGLQEIFSLDSLVIAMTGRVSNIDNRITALLQNPGKSHIGVIDPTGLWCLGGSDLAQAQGNIGATDQVPDVDMSRLKEMVCIVQDLIKQGIITAVHDTVGDGMFTAIAEMAMASCAGVTMNFGDISQADLFAHMFAKEAKLVVEYMPPYLDTINAAFEGTDTIFHRIGYTHESDVSGITILANSKPVLDAWTTSHARKMYSLTNTELVWEEIMQAGGDVELARQELQCMSTAIVPQPYVLTFDPVAPVSHVHTHIKAAIIRDHGSNGDTEMAHMFRRAGFNAIDVDMQSILDGAFELTDDVHVAVFVGGFSSSDTLGAGVGWASKIRHNERVFTMFKRFFERDTTLTLGVCNGCQTLSILADTFIPQFAQGDIRFVQNDSHVFESRLIRMRINETPAIMLRGMEGAVLSAVVAHGEGKMQFASDAVGQRFEENLVPVQCVDYEHNVTEQYPLNPNGSLNGNLGFTSPCGRFLAMMPHPEREVEVHILQNPDGYPMGMLSGPYLKMAHNAMEWVKECIQEA